MKSKRGFLSISTATMYYEMAGEGDALLLIHGIDSDSRMWDQQFQEFARHFKVIRFDLRGFGKTVMPTGEFQVLDDIQRLLHGLGLEETHIVGYSYGGTIAPSFAIKYPEMVKSLTLVGAGMVGYTWSEQVSSYFKQFQECYKRNDFDEMMRMLRWKSIYGPKREEVGYEDICQLLTDMFLPVLKRQDLGGKPVSTGDTRSQLHTINAPTLILVGELDFDDYHHIANFYQKNIRNSIKITFPNAAHFLNLEYPEQFNNEVLHFLQNL